jgi:hypothetical protein
MSRPPLSQKAPYGWALAGAEATAKPTSATAVIPARFILPPLSVVGRCERSVDLVADGAPLSSRAGKDVEALAERYSERPFDDLLEDPEFLELTAGEVVALADEYRRRARLATASAIEDERRERRKLKRASKEGTP